MNEKKVKHWKNGARLYPEGNEGAMSASEQSGEITVLIC